VTTREIRLEKNQESFRNANQKLGNIVGDKVGRQETIPFLCECPDDECLDVVSVSLTEYERIHSHPDRYIVVKGHPTSPGERMVEERDGYWIVEKGDDE
jgi:hypothetical protein